MNNSIAGELRLIQLTPPGRGAVATLRIEGPRAIETVAAYFSSRGKTALKDLPTDRPTLGNFGGEEIVVRKISERAIDLHGHGGVAAVERIKQALIAAGCRQVSWQEWLAEQEEDSIAAEARIALAEARTQRTAAILLDQYGGALRRSFDEIEACSKSGHWIAAIELCETLLARAPLGLHLVEPWQIVIAGRPNVGKSSLINAVAGYQRAIVHAMPGTTRDVVTVQTAVDGWPIRLADTAGLRATDDSIERSGMGLAREKLRTADLVVLVFDRTVPWSDEDRHLVGEYPGAMIVHNKADLEPATGPRPEGLAVSAMRRDGIDEFCTAVAARLMPEPPMPGDAVPFTLEHVEKLRSYLGTAKKKPFAPTCPSDGK